MNPDAPLANPYVGPSTFSYEQRHLFFGREREARDLLARVLSERLLLFYAQSGAGKSSLLNTRLIPQLEEDKGLVVLPVTRVSGELPAGVAQVDNIFVYNLLLSIDEGDDPGRLARVTLSDFLARLTRRTANGHEHPARRGWAYAADTTPAPASPNGRRYALIIDQFEEIITSHPARWGEREGLFRQIDAAMQSDPNLWVVLTLREDYVAALDPYAALMSDRLRARFYMERMGVAAALEAIRKPAEVAGRPFGPGVAQKLADDLRQVHVPGQKETVAGQYVEPVQLQVVCYQLWEGLEESGGQRTEGGGQKPGEDEGRGTKDEGLPLSEAKGRMITFEDLARAGDVDRALTQFYEETLAAALADPAAAGVSERQLRTWFDEKLITAAGTRGLVHQGESETGGLPNGIVAALQKRFLVRSEARGGDAWIELVHDRLVEPIRASNAAWFPQHLSALQRQAKLWDDEKRRDGLLLGGEALAEAERWAAGHEGEMESYEREFLEACREARAVVERERKQNRRIRVLGVVAGVVGVLAIGLTLIAFTLARQSVSARKHYEYQTRRTQAVELAAQAQTALADRPASPDLALLLARWAITTTYETDGYVTDQARDALVKAMAAAAPWKPFLADPERTFGRAFFAASGTRLVTQESDGVVRLWDAATGTEIDHFESQPWLRVGIIDDRYFFTLSDGKTYVRDTTDGKAIVELPGEFYGVTIGPTMERIVTHGELGWTLWDAKTQTALMRKQNTDSRVEFSSDGERLWFSDSYDRLQLLDAGTGKELPLAASGYWLEISNRVVIVESFDSGIDLRDAHTGKALHPFGKGVAISDAGVDAHDARIAVISEKGGARVLDAQTGKILYEITEAGVEQLKFSQSGELLAVKMKDDGWRMLRAGDGSEVKSLPDAADVWFDRHDENIAVVDQEGEATIRGFDSSEPMKLGDVGQDAIVSFSEDGKRVAILGTSNGIEVWDVATGNSIYAIDETKANPESLSFSPDGRYVYINNELWDSERRRKLFPDVELDSIEFSADGRLAILNGQNSATVWDATTYRQQLPLGADFESIAFQDDGSNILTTNPFESYNTYLNARLWKGATGEELKYFQSAAAWWDKGRFLIGADPDGNYALFDLATGEEKLSFGRASDSSSAWLSEDGRLAVVEDADGVDHLWDIERQEERFTLGEGARCAGFSEDGRFVAMATVEGELHVWSTIERGNKALLRIPISYGSCNDDIRFSNDGRMLAVWYEDSKSGESLYRIWNLQTREEMLKDFAPFEEVEFSPDGAFIRTKALNDAPRLWDAQTEQQVAADITDSVSSLCFVESAKPALVYDCDSAQKLWNLQSGEELILTEAATAHVFSPDARWVVAFSTTAPPRVWNLAEGKLRYSLPAGIDDSKAVFSPKGDFLAAADSEKGRAYVFEVETGNMIGELPIEEGQTVSALSPDGGLLVVGDERGVDVLDIRNQKRLWRFARVYPSIEFSPDGRYLVIDGATIWPATPAVLLELAAPLIQRRPAELTEGERKEYGLE